MFMWEIFRREMNSGENFKAAAFKRAAWMSVPELRQAAEQGSTQSVLCLAIVLQMHKVHY